MLILSSGGPKGPPGFQREMRREHDEAKTTVESGHVNELPTYHGRMKKKHKTNRNNSLAGAPVATASPTRRPSVAAIMATVSLIGAVVAFAWWRSTHAETQPAAPVTDAASTSRPTAAIESNSAFQKLKGKWVRPDGGYVFEIKSVEDGGKIVASYSNPRPINVSKAEASQDGACDQGVH